PQAIGQQLRSCRLIHRTREQVALSELATQRNQLVDLFDGLRAFGYNFQSETVGQANDGANDRPVVGVGIHVGYKGAVNLQDIYGEMPQPAERRGSGPEIVNAQSNTQRLRLAKYALRFVGVSHGDGLHNLQVQAAS